MSAAWVRARVDLGRDPKVIAMAERLRRDARFLAWAGCDCVSLKLAIAAACKGLIDVWGVLRTDGAQDGDDLTVSHATLATIDAIADTPGLGDAMAAVGWAAERPADANGNMFLILPKFFRQNASTEKMERKRKADRERMQTKRAASRESRATSCDTPGDVAANRATEESRVEESRGVNTDPPQPPEGGGGEVAPQTPPARPSRKKSDPLPPVPPELGAPEFVSAWERWRKYRAELHQPVTATMAAGQFRQFVEWGVPRAVAAIDHTIAKGWQGLKEPPPAQQGGRAQPDIYERQKGVLDFLRKAEEREARERVATIEVIA